MRITGLIIGSGVVLVTGLLWADHLFKSMEGEKAGEAFGEIVAFTGDVDGDEACGILQDLRVE